MPSGVHLYRCSGLLPKEGEMAVVCDGTWRNSKINGNPDGTINVTESAGGVLTGRHNKSRRNIIGRCTGGVKPHIRFARMDDDGCLYVYDGLATRVTSPVAKLVIMPGDGTVTKICGPFERDRGKQPLFGDDWTAEKQT